MAYCSECAKLEDAAEAATLEYDELLIQQNRTSQAAGGDALSSAREKRDQLRKQLSEHKAVHL